MIVVQRKLNRLRNNWRTSTTQPTDETTNHPSRENMVQRMSRRFSRMSSIGSLRSYHKDNDVTNSRDVMCARPSVNPPSSLRSTPNQSFAIRQSEMDRNLQLQAVLYTLAFIVTYVFTYVHRILVMTRGSSPFIILYLPRIFRPLQGLFNIIIYTRIRVSRLRTNTGYSWIKAFYTVVKSFDDHDDMTRVLSYAGDGRQRRSSIFQRLFNGSHDNSNPPSFPIMNKSDIGRNDKVKSNQSMDNFDGENDVFEYEKEQDKTSKGFDQLQAFSEKDSNSCFSEKDSSSSHVNSFDIPCKNINTEKNEEVNVEAPQKDENAGSVSDTDENNRVEKEKIGDECDIPLSNFTSNTTPLIVERDQMKDLEEGKDKEKSVLNP